MAAPPQITVRNLSGKYVMVRSTPSMLRCLRISTNSSIPMQWTPRRREEISSVPIGYSGQSLTLWLRLVSCSLDNYDACTYMIWLHLNHWPSRIFPAVVDLCRFSEIRDGRLTDEIQNKTLSNPSDPLLAIQGMGWLTRKAIGMATVTVRLTNHHLPLPALSIRKVVLLQSKTSSL